MRWPGTLLAALALGFAAASDEDWSQCPGFCRCKWVSGRKAAECANSSLRAVPDSLSREIQSLDLSNNQLNKLPADAFRDVGLINLHKAYLRDAGLTDLHRHALRGLQILIELDLSGNKLHTLHPGTFSDNVRLRIVILSRNPLTELHARVFEGLQYLQTVELSNCALTRIDAHAFTDLPALQTLKLNGNHLTTLSPDALQGLERLKSLELHANPWRCDCRLKAFRDWTLDHNLYAQPTSCREPPHLAGKLWSELATTDLACRPEILWPPDYPDADHQIVEATSENVTLSCRVKGSPPPKVHWVFNARIAANHSRRAYGEQWYTITEDHGNPQWVNLTIHNVRHSDHGEYTCVAKSSGGIEERNVSLVVSGDRMGAAGMPGSLPWILVLCISIIVLVVAVVVLISFCFCRSRTTRDNKKPPNAITANGDVNLTQGEQEDLLITRVNPVQKPPRTSASVTMTSIELAEKKTLLDDGSVFTAQSVTDSDDLLQDRSMDSLDNPPQRLTDTLPQLSQIYPPDLLSFPRGSQVSPAGSTASTAPDNSRLPPQSPIHSPVYHSSPLSQFGTLPYSRSQSPFSPPVVLPRPGYVTIPRRPRVPSWTAPSPTLVVDPLGLKPEPVYDNLGPRTTVDGSSVLSLNKCVPPETPRRLLPVVPSYQTNTLPTYYSPIVPIEEQPSPVLPRANTSKGSHQRSTPNISVTKSPLPSPVSAGNPTNKLLDGMPKQRGSFASPESLIIHRRSDETLPKRNSIASPIGNGTTKKVPPKPPPKPKKKSTDSVSGPLYEDEGEDGTEV